MPVLPSVLTTRFKMRKVFSPLDISGLDLWLDASDGNTLYDATSGGSLVTTDGSAVKRWEDKSGNGNHATEATAAPLLEVAEKNGLNALNFATSKFLTCSFTSKTYTAETVFAVIKFTTSAQSFGRILTQSISSGLDYAITGHHIPLLRNATATQVCNYTGGAARSPVSASNGTWYIARTRHTGSAVTTKLNTTEGASYSHTLNRNFDLYRIGDAYTNPQQATAFWNGLISEIIIYTKSLSDSESDSVTNYLNNKWAVY